MSPRIQRDAPLRARNTFGVDATAACLAEVDDLAALPALLRAPPFVDAPLRVLGGGSNYLFAGDVDGVLLSLRADAITIAGERDDAVLLRAEAGAGWHALVMRSLELGLSGLENLALIPGTAGAAPIQNIGAYGVEVDSRIDVVEALDRGTGRIERLAAADCGFAYRDSRFKREPDRWIVTAVEFALTRTPRLQLGYAGLADELAALGIDAPTPGDVAEAVVRIRRRKLPDPTRVGNAGSFFKNPIVPLAQADALSAAHPALPVFRGAGDDSRKLSAAWLIDACGWKGRRDGDAGISEAHALVLVNHGHASGAQLLAFARRVAADVEARFGVALEPEPRLVGAAW